MVPAFEATLAWKRFTAFFEVSALGHSSEAMPTAKAAESLRAHPEVHCPPQDTQPLPGYPLNAWSLLFPSAALVPPH